MPKVALEIPETYDSITRPVTIGVVRDLIDYFELPNDIGVRYMGNVGELAQRGSQLSGVRSNQSFPFGEVVDVDLVETYLEDGVMTTAVKRHENNPVFNDPALMVSLKPIYTKTQATLTFKYRANSKTEAYKWRDTVRRRMTQGTQALLHELIYHYPIPAPFHVILEAIHEKRESQSGYGDTFSDWLRAHYDDRMTILSNLDGTRGSLVIPEKQIQVQGWLSFEDQPDEPEMDGEGDRWVVELEYTFQYDKVTAVLMDYPIVVHNQLMDDRFLDLQTPYNPYNVKRRPSHTGRLNDTFSRINYNPEAAFTGVRIPNFDDWSPRGSSYRTVPIFTSLIGVEESDPNQIVNLLDLGETALTQSVVNFLYRHRDNVPHYLNCAFHLTFYKGDLAVDPGGYYVDEDMNVRATHPLNPRDIHHVRLSLVSHLKGLSEQAKEAMRNDPEVCFQIVDALDGLQRPNLPFVTGSNAQSTHNSTQATGSRPNTRPGFGMVSGDYAHIKPKSGNPRFLYPKSQKAEKEGRVWNPVHEVLKNAQGIPDYETLQEWIEQGAWVALTTGMDHGKEDVIAQFEQEHYQLTINHFLKSTVLKAKRLTVAELMECCKSPEFFWTNPSPGVQEYLDQTLNTLGTEAFFSDSEIKKLLTAETTTVIANDFGIIKPTFDYSRPKRIKSPARPNVAAPLLSDDLVILGKKVITRPSFDWVVNKIPTQTNLSNVQQSRGLFTVMQAGIVLHRS